MSGSIGMPHLSSQNEDDRDDRQNNQRAEDIARVATESHCSPGEGDAKFRVCAAVA